MSARLDDDDCDPDLRLCDLLPFKGLDPRFSEAPLLDESFVFSASAKARLYRADWSAVRRTTVELPSTVSFVSFDSTHTVVAAAFRKLTGSRQISGVVVCRKEWLGTLGLSGDEPWRFFSPSSFVIACQISEAMED